MSDEIKIEKVKTKKTKTKAIQLVEPKQEMALLPESLISQAIEKGVPVETMEKLLAMRRELKAEFAKEEFDRAMSAFQSECPTIKKTKAGGKTNSGQVAYYYAPLESIVEQVKELLSKNGFSYLIKTETRVDGVKATCIVKHISGHSEFSEIDLPLGTRTNVMSAPQVTAAATTFAKRYAFSNAFGILTGDEDKDASPEIIDGITQEDLDDIDKPSKPQAPRVYNMEPSKPMSKTAEPQKLCPLCNRWHFGKYAKCLDCWKKDKSGEKIIQTKTIVNHDAEPFKS